VAAGASHRTIPLPNVVVTTLVEHARQFTVGHPRLARRGGAAEELRPVVLGHQPVGQLGGTLLQPQYMPRVLAVTGGADDLD
jgi:hypothetical protein